MTASVRSLRVEYGGRESLVDVRRPRFSWKIDDARPGARQTGYEIQLAKLAVSAHSDAGDGDSVFSSPLWESGRIESGESVFVEYDGPELESLSSYSVRVRVQDALLEWGAWSEPCRFSTAFLDAPWSAQWIMPNDDLGDQSGPSPYLRREFSIDADVISARLYASARGLMELSINGSRLGDHVLSPGWTDYEFRAQYVAHDVTALVQRGENAMGAILGDGWYAGRIARIRDERRRFGNRPQFLCELHIATATGTTIVSSDGTWVWTTGSILSSDIYDGEEYDARLEIPGWDTVAIDGGSAGRPEKRADGSAVSWQPVTVVGAADAGWRGTGTALLDAKINPPVRRIRELVAVERTEPQPGVHVYDLGQNITGWARVGGTGTAGSPVTIRFAEMLNDDGTLYVENLRSARATDSYTPATGGAFTFEPHFTFHGFRYVEVAGTTVAPELELIVGIVLHNDMTPTGSFASSSELVNQLQSNIQWGQRGNYLEAPTDCPQRDERLGWTGDAQVFIPTGAYNFDVNSFFVKWQRDLIDSQGAEGTIPSVAPAVRYMAPEDDQDGGPAWSDAFVICPWVIYQRYGDRRILEESYPAMRRFVASMEARSRGLIRSDEFVWDWGGYGDWVSMDAPEGSSVGATPKDLIGTAYFAHCADLLARIADLLGRERDSRELRDLHRRIVAAFQSEFVTPSGRVLGDTQTSYVVALAFDMLPIELHQSAIDRLVRQLEARNWRLSTGFVGTASLCNVLNRSGRPDVAYRLLLQEEFPSWLYTVKQGATTMWERWNSYTLDKGFGPVSMNSFNHYAYGAIGDWMYSHAAGLSIDLSQPGRPPLSIRPEPGHGLTHAAAELETPFGTARSEWRLEEDGAAVFLQIAIPANTAARVEIDADFHPIEIGLRSDATQQGSREIAELVVRDERSTGPQVFTVASGSYEFRWRRASTA